MPEYPRSPLRKVGPIVRSRVTTDTLEIIDNMYYGVSWDESANTYTRTGALINVSVGSSPGDALLPIQAAMRRCVLNDAGVVQYYLEPDDSYNRLGHAPSITGIDDAGTANKVSDTGVFTLVESEYKGKYVHNTTDDTYALITAKDSNDVLSIDTDIMANGENFEICTAGIGDGGDGQVMVEIPQLYYRYGYSGTTHTWEISPLPLDGFSIHPAFIIGSEIVQAIYISAYEGSMYDASASAMVPDADIEVPYTIEIGDLLCSLSGEYPKTNETRDDYRNLSARRGTGWKQYDYDLASAIQLLYLVEYADFDSQSMISNGRTMFTGGDWEAANQGNGKYIGKCGYSNSDGNVSGGHSRAAVVNIAAINTETNTAYHDYMSYRGIENFFGNVWKWVDGINVNDRNPYVSNNSSDYQDDTTDKYTPLDITMPASTNYQQTLHSQDRGFLPATVGADISKITDYYWQAAGWRVVLLGGNAVTDDQSGAFTFSADNISGSVVVNYGGRLVFIPVVVTNKAIPASGSIDNLNVNTEQDLITEVTVTTATRIDSIIIDFTNWLADASIAASGATLTIKLYMDDDGGTLREIGNLQDVVTEGISEGNMVQVNGPGTFERNFKVTVQSSISPAGGAASDLVKYHYATYDVE